MPQVETEGEQPRGPLRGRGPLGLDGGRRYVHGGGAAEGTQRHLPQHRVRLLNSSCSGMKLHWTCFEIDTK